MSEDLNTLREKVKALEQEVDAWKRGWFQLRGSLGKTAWVEYYRGVEDQKNRRVYGREESA